MDAGDSDEALMLRFAAGEAGAFDLLYARHRTGLYRFVLRQLGRERHLADEMVQDVWTSLIAARTGYKPSARFGTWLYTIARNRVVDHHRRLRPVDLPGQHEDDVDPVQHHPAPATAQPERIAQGRQQAARLLALVEVLPVAQREAFLLHEEGGLNVDEIAAVTGADREAVKSRLRYALARLRQGMEGVL
ncbi:MAG: RNA polymerase sigma factor [Burkholderiales bacterium]|nr:RNA polymerase sigma factor [Burkholderiales bacterium]